MAQNSLEQYRLFTANETGLEFGRGSYAAVVEVDYKGLRCAGKKIHRILYEGQVDNLIRRFEEECRLLSQLRHPHIVQFLGIYFEVDTNVPVLVMEFLPTTLTQCLDHYGVMPEEINYSILQDVAVGLRYLHDRQNPIIHRDLSANNVLVTADMRAKISDLGVAKIADANPRRIYTMTKVPGIDCYMPPEVMSQRPRYGVKVDVFSYGVMMVHMLSGQWPFPGEAVQLNPSNPHDPDDVIGVTEFNRRKEYINLIEKQHPLMSLIQRCLSNSPSHRPTSSEVHQRVSAVAANNPPSFANRVEMMERIKALSQEKEDMRVQVSDLQAEVGHLQIASSSNQTSTSRTSNPALPCLRENLPSGRDSSLSFLPRAGLKFTKMTEMPLPLDGANLVYVKGKVYVHCKYHDSGEVLQYSICDDSWKILPKPPIIYFTICSLLGKVFLIGGWIHGSSPLRSGSIQELDDTSQQWVTTTSIPPMPTARSSATAVSWTSPEALIICGGENKHEKAIDIVEVYHTLTSQWYSVSPLPFPCSHMMYTIIDDSLFLVGGQESYFYSTKSVLVMYTVSDLFKQCFQKVDTAVGPGQWHYLPDIPNYCSGTATLGGSLLAIGGQSQPYAGEVYSSVYAFSLSTSSWVHIGDLPRPHTDCGAITLPSGELLVIGGEEESFASSKCVYIGSIVF